MTFLAEIAPQQDGSTVHFRYVIDGSAELVISRQWWEQLGEPGEVDVSVQPVN